MLTRPAQAPVCGPEEPRQPRNPRPCRRPGEAPRSPLALIPWPPGPNPPPSPLRPSGSCPQSSGPTLRLALEPASPTASPGDPQSSPDPRVFLDPREAPGAPVRGTVPESQGALPHARAQHRPTTPGAVAPMDPPARLSPPRPLQPASPLSRGPRESWPGVGSTHPPRAAPCKGYSGDTDGPAPYSHSTPTARRAWPQSPRSRGRGPPERKGIGMRSEPPADAPTNTHLHLRPAPCGAHCHPRALPPKHAHSRACPRGAAQPSARLPLRGLAQLN